jgi:hypothetical protein
VHAQARAQQGPIIERTAAKAYPSRLPSLARTAAPHATPHSSQSARRPERSDASPHRGFVAEAGGASGERCDGAWGRRGQRLRRIGGEPRPAGGGASPHHSRGRRAQRRCGALGWHGRNRRQCGTSGARQCDQPTAASDASGWPSAHLRI